MRRLKLNYFHYNKDVLKKITVGEYKQINVVQQKSYVKLKCKEVNRVLI